ncbi:MAG TPA: cytochrome b N-terminal domain-containing protein [Burkholderiales bacterium]|nr:cytochrome b N-terminal domain-containing protein [Burkholderiales bacterium]
MYFALKAPLRHLGALGFWLFWALAASGITLYIRFDTSVEGAYASIGELEWWFGGVLRSVHRYAADAFVVVVVAHLIKELWEGKFRGWRAFSWISGVPLVWLMYASGIVGYWLVWDARSQFSYLATLEWADISAAGVETPSDRLFSLFVFLHIGLPLALLAGMWVHVQRLGRPATAPPRLLAGAMLAFLLALALIAPVSSEARWEPAAQPATLALDWFLLFAHPLMYATSPGTLSALVLGATAVLAALPYLKRLRTRAARVDPANCNGCGRCVADCPYEAVRLEDGKASVLAERCAACGICAGACPSSTPFRSVAELVSGIDLPDLTVHDLRRKLQASLPAEEVVFRCEKSGAGGIALPCVAMLPPSFIEYALRNGARRVRVAACREGECAYRLGPALARERFAGEREPRLRRTVRHESHDDEHRFSYR